MPTSLNLPCIEVKESWVRQGIEFFLTFKERPCLPTRPRSRESLLGKPQLKQRTKQMGQNPGVSALEAKVK